MKKRTGIAEERKAEVLEGLKRLGEDIYNSLNAGRFPEIYLPSRSVRNILFDPSLRQYVLGPTKVRRSSHNIKHIRPFTQLIWLAFFVKKLIKEQKTSTLRDIFYSAQAFNVDFEDQDESDEIITELETVLMKAREDFNVFPEERSAIFGNLTIEYTVPGYEGRRLDLTSHPDGVMIGPALTTAEFVDTDAEMVLAIEKGGLFTRFVEEKVHERFKALLVNTAGQPPRSTRYLLRRLNRELGLPVYIFSVDGEESIVIEKDGLLRTLRIGELVDDEMAKAGYPAKLAEPPLLYVERLNIGSSNALSVDSSGKVVIGDVLYVLRHPVYEPVYRVKLKGGYSVKVTNSHSLIVFDESSYSLRPKKVEDIRAGDLVPICVAIPNPRSIKEVNVAEFMLRTSPEVIDRLCVVGEGSIRIKYHGYRGQIRRRAIPLRELLRRGLFPKRGRIRFTRSKASLPLTLKLTSELARLLGYFASNGSYKAKKRGIKLTFDKSKAGYVRDAIECVRRALGINPKVTYSHRTTSVHLYGNIIAYLFERVLGTGRERDGKEIPFIIFNASNAFKMNFLLGYLRGAGRVKGQGSGFQISCSTVSRKLASDIITLCSQLGVEAYLKEGGRDYKIIIEDKESLKRIKEIVKDLVGTEKTESVLRARCNGPSLLHSIPAKVVLYISDIIITRSRPERREEVKRILRTFKETCSSNEGRIDNQSVRELISRLEINPIDHRIGFLRELTKGNIALLPVEKVEKVAPTSSYVYDIEVAGTHTFVGGVGNLVLHNTDADPWGMHIAMVIISGSANAAHLRDLTTPDAKWAGVWASDITKYRLPHDRLTDLDIKRLYELKADPRYDEKLWRDEIETFLRHKRKAEQEAFARYGLTYIVDKYLPYKLEMVKSL